MLFTLTLILAKVIEIIEKMSGNTDDLEKTLMIAAAAADSRQYEENRDQSPDYTHKNCKTEDLNSQEYKRKGRTNIDNPSQSNTVDTHSSPSNEIKTKRKSEPEPEPQTDDVPKGKKRKHDDSASDTTDTQNSERSHSQVVATHYNLIEEKGLQERSKSRIVYLRKFHNWIKSMFINEYLTKIRDIKKQHNPPLRVLDMCCGKGGDLEKWKKGNIRHLICSDIAEVSLEHCKQRYADMKKRSQDERGRNAGNLFSMEVVHGDLGKLRLREKFTDPSVKLDLVSCQFSFHYMFESLPQAECMMKNASECLLPGGYFIGTMTNSNEIIARSRKSEDGSFGNDVYQVSVDFDMAKPPLFGGKYNFQLKEVVNCPEFLVHFPTFVKLAKKHGLKLVRKETFWQFFERMKGEGRQLLGNMGALESYPPNEGVTLVGDAPDDYQHAKEYVQKLDGEQMIKIGTLSKSEWEASSIYLTFAFEKVKNTWNSDGTPCYDII